MQSTGLAALLDVWCFRLLLLLLFLVPLPLGSNRNGPLGLMALSACILAALACWALVLRGRSPWAYLVSARWPLFALTVYVALVIAQMHSGPEGTWVSSADVFQTQRYLLASLSYLAAFAAVLMLVSDEQRLRAVMLALLVCGVVQALLAIALLSFRANYQFIYTDLSHVHRALGTFVNPNHLASYLYLCLSAGVGLLIAGLGQGAQAHDEWKDRMKAVMAFVMSPKMLVRLTLVIMVIALVLSRSRMGNAAFFVAVSIVGLVVAWRFRDSRKLALLLVGSLLLVDVVIVGQWVGLERVMQRIEGTALERMETQSAEPGSRAREETLDEESVEARSEAARLTIPMVRERPWTGHGGGTYFTVFPRFKSPEMQHLNGYFDHAHSDYAEIAADTGLVGLGLLGVVMLLTAGRGLRLLRPELPATAQAAGGAALMAVTCVAIHSAVDFSLQIPAVAFTFIFIAGIAWAVPLRPGVLKRRSESDSLAGARPSAHERSRPSGP